MIHGYNHFYRSGGKGLSKHYDLVTQYGTSRLQYCCFVHHSLRVEEEVINKDGRKQKYAVEYYSSQ